MTSFIAIVQNGKLTFKNDFMREKFVKFVKFHEGKRVFITPTFKESDKQRGFYHGAVITLWAYLDGKDYTDGEVLKHIHEIAKMEFNPEAFVLNGKVYKVGKSTIGKLNEGYIEKIIDSLEENYGIDRTKVLDPKEYKKWRDEVYPFGGPEDYIDYLLELNLLKK